MKSGFGGYPGRLRRLVACALLALPIGAHCHAAGSKYGEQASAPFDDGKRIPLRDTLWWQAATERGLDPYVLYAVALVESAKVSRRQARPWPWALNRGGRPIIPSSWQEARETLHDSLSKGLRSIDVGLMQVNYRWNGHRVNRPEDLLDPATNVRIGAEVLAEAIESAPGDLVLGIGRYHAGRNDARAYPYGRRVLAIASQIRWLL